MIMLPWVLTFSNLHHLIALYISVPLIIIDNDEYNTCIIGLEAVGVDRSLTLPVSPL